MPPWILGCRVLTRPSRISGNPVTSATWRTLMPASCKVLKVPPVDMISYPNCSRPRANSTTPSLFDTLIRALFIVFQPPKLCVPCVLLCKPGLPPTAAAPASKVGAPVPICVPPGCLRYRRPLPAPPPA